MSAETDLRAPSSPGPPPAGGVGGGYRFPALIAVTSVLVGLGLMLIGMALEAGGMEVVGGDAPINVGAIDKADINAHNSPSVARHPIQAGRLAVVNRIDTPLFSCALHISDNSGANWERREIPFPAGEEQPPRCYAPDLAFGADGTLYLSFVTLIGPGNVPNALWITTSGDGGATFSVPNRVSGPLAFQARLVTDPTQAGLLYLTWLQASDTATLGFPVPGYPIVFSRSEDGGATWQAPVRVSPPSRGRVVAPSLAVGTRGELYSLFLDVGEDSLDYHGAHAGQGGDPYPGPWTLVVSRSLDRGATWQEAVVDDEVRPTERFIVFFPATPSLAVDRRSGRVHVGFHDGRQGDADVLVWTSADGGSTFGPPVRVNDTPRGDGRAQYMPKLAVAPDGRVDVVYYDRRADQQNVLNEVSMQSSTDGGKSFSRRQRLSTHAFDSRIGFGDERGMPDLGSRLGLISDDDRALAVWTDTRAGTEASNKQDLARAVMAFTDASPFRLPLLLGGAALAAAGLIVVAAAGLRSLSGTRRGREVLGRGRREPAGSAWQS